MSEQGNKPPSAQPTVTSVKPDHGSQGQQNKIITITGTNFTDVHDVSFGPGIKVNKFDRNSNTTITATISIAPNAALEARDVSVTTSSGGTDTLTEGFTVLGKELPEIPQRKDTDYGKRVLEVSVNPEDVATMANDQEKKESLKKELITCDRLVSDWGDCSKVVQYCKKLIESAHDDAAKGEFIEAHKKLWEVRQRLVQAWHSKRKRKVFGIAAWLIVALGGCMYLLVWEHLLPGETSRVAESNVNVAALYSSFLFGAIGGIFDALSAWSKHYTDQTFDSDWWPWYFCCPFLGAILGAVVFAAFLAGLLVTTGGGLPSSGNTTANVLQNLGNLTPSQLSAVQNAASNTAEPSARAALILVLAFIAGFKQVAVTDFLERIAKSVFGESKQ